MAEPARLISINRSPGGIPKTPVPEAAVTIDGVVDDGHDHEKHRTPVQAISLLDVEDLDDLRTEGFDVGPGALGENFTVANLSVDALEIGDRLHFEGGLCLELTKRRKPCYVLDAIDPTLRRVAVGRIGFYARVVTTAVVRPNAAIRVDHRAESATDARAIAAGDNDASKTEASDAR